MSIDEVNDAEVSAMWWDPMMMEPVVSEWRGDYKDSWALDVIKNYGELINDPTHSPEEKGEFYRQRAALKQHYIDGACGMEGLGMKVNNMAAILLDFNPQQDLQMAKKLTGISGFGMYHW